VLHTWLSQTTYQLFYTLDGARANYLVGRAYRVNRVASVTVFVIGAGLFVWQYLYLRQHYYLGSLLLIAFLYLFTLLLQNYADFIHLGYPFGIQGRYLIPMLPIIYAAIGVAVGAACRKLPIVKPYVAVVAMIVIVTQAGGVSTYILRSEPAWYWPNPIVIRANDVARHILRPFVIGN
jgi:hypothetical protein